MKSEKRARLGRLLRPPPPPGASKAPTYRPKRTFAPLGSVPQPGHPFQRKHVPLDAERQTGEWIEDTFGDAYIFPALVVWLWDQFPGRGQRANLVVWDYWGDSFVLLAAGRDYEPKFARELAEGGTSEESPDITIEAGWNLVHQGDIVAYHADLGTWSAPIESARH